MGYDEACAEEARIMGALEPVEDYEYRSSVQLMPDEDDGYFVCLAWYKWVIDEDGRLREYGNFLGLPMAGLPVDGLKKMIYENYTRTKTALHF